MAIKTDFKSIVFTASERQQAFAAGVDLDDAAASIGTAIADVTRQMDALAAALGAADAAGSGNAGIVLSMIATLA